MVYLPAVSSVIRFITNHFSDPTVSQTHSLLIASPTLGQQATYGRASTLNHMADSSTSVNQSAAGQPIE